MKVYYKLEFDQSFLYNELAVTGSTELEKQKELYRNMFLRGMSAEDAAAICEEDLELVRSWFQTWADTSAKGV